jgi:hypothetical protein
MFVFRNATSNHNTRALGKLSSLATEYTSAATARRPTTLWTTHPTSTPSKPLYRTLSTTPIMSAPLTAWKRLIRYVSTDGSIKYGEPIVSDEKNPDIDALAQKGGLKVKVLGGDNPILAKPTGEEDEVKQLLGPLTPKDVPIVRCVGLNYRTHSKFLLYICHRIETEVHSDMFLQFSRQASTSPPTQPSSSNPRTQ